MGLLTVMEARRTYAWPHSDAMSLTMDWSFARISVCRRDSLTFRS